VEADYARCGKCGAVLAPAEAEGLCPRCLVDLAIAGTRAGAAGADAALHPLKVAGDRVGPYEIVSLISRGGMGEVYRANDTRIDRTVAVKLLSPGVVESLARRDRFEREARAVSSLNHPHICSLYDVGEQDETPFLVMEYVEGETLAERLARGALPTDQVLRHSIEIAEALDHAHRHGVVHRDLKPANVMLTGSGVKLLDFGVAKLESRPIVPDGTSPAPPGPLQAITEDGTVVGTLSYMAPEQLDARGADARTDIFAFGAVVHEMATGRRAFSASNRDGLVEAILHATPAGISAGGGSTRTRLEDIVRRCLAKNPGDRWQTASELKEALVQISGSARRRSRGWFAAAAIAAIAILIAIVLAVTSSLRNPADARPFRFIVLPPDSGSFNQSSAFMAVSPDGHSLAFVASSREGRNALWIRSLDSLDARALSGTDDAGQPFWSMNGQFLAFGRTSGPDTLNAIEVTSGVSQTVAGVRAAPGTWNDDGVILFPAGRRQGGLNRASASGGPPTPVTVLDESRGETSHAWPHFLPDGQRFIFLARSTQPEHDGVVYAGSLDSADRVRLVKADSQAVYAPPGYLLYLQVNALVAQPFDPVTLRVTGEPIVVAKQVERTAGTFRGAFSISPRVLAYRPIGETALAWYDRAGRELHSIGPVGQYSNPTLSPDEQRLAVGRLNFETGASDIWLMDLARGDLASRFASDAAPEEMPLWCPDGGSIVFRSSTGLYERASSGGATSVLVSSQGSAVGFAQDFARDRPALIYTVRGRESGFDVWMAPTAGDRTPVPLLRTGFNEGHARLSPNGRWMAYVSDESGRYEVYVRAFPSGDGKRQISVQGGLEPAWSGSGRELFYLAPDRSLMTVSVEAGSTLDAGLPSRLFETRMSVVFNPTYTRNQYLVSADGQRFLINQAPGGLPPSPVTVVINWPAVVKR
jgi:serine/threonine protein kinase